MNKDGIKELIVAPRWSVNEYTNYDIRIFSCTNSEEGYKLSVISGHEWISNISTNGGVCLPSNGNGLLLRHKPEKAGIHLDEHGWTDMEELIQGVSKTHMFNMEILEEIVRTDKKQRFSIHQSDACIQ